VDGADVVLHLAGGPKGDDAATRNLVRAASRAGVRHLVYISVIGARGKRRVMVPVRIPARPTARTGRGEPVSRGRRGRQRQIWRVSTTFAICRQMAVVADAAWVGGS
jgi:nucleoside-diphosphate-sugar epimerase